MLCIFVSTVSYLTTKFDFFSTKNQKANLPTLQLSKPQQSKCLMDAIQRIIGTTLDIKGKSGQKTNQKRNVTTWHMGL